MDKRPTLKRDRLTLHLAFVSLVIILILSVLGSAAFAATPAIPDGVSVTAVCHGLTTQAAASGGTAGELPPCPELSELGEDVVSHGARSLFPR